MTSTKPSLTLQGSPEDPRTRLIQQLHSTSPQDLAFYSVVLSSHLLLRRRIRPIDRRRYHRSKTLRLLMRKDRKGSRRSKDRAISSRRLLLMKSLSLPISIAAL